MSNLALTPEQLADAAKKIREKNTPAASGVVPNWPISGSTPDAEIKSRAAQIAYGVAVPAQLVATILFLERRVAQLEEAARNTGAPHLAKTEKR